MKTIQDYFSIKELVNPTVYQKYGEGAWQFICPMLQETMLVVRETINKPITVNNWHNGGSFSQRGLRTNIDPLVKKKTGLYLSAHLFGKAVDFDVAGMSAVEVREWLVDNGNLLPYKIRLENLMKGKPISWVHLDVFQNEKNPKVYLFNV